MATTGQKRKRAPTTILYLIPEPTAIATKTKPELTDRLLRDYDASPIGVWSADHRMFRSTPRGDESDKEIRYQHLLHFNLEHRRDIDRAKICFTGSPQGQVVGQNQNQNAQATNDAPGPDVTISSIPAKDLSNYSQLLSTKLTALWMPRAALYVSNGSSYAVGGGAGAGFVVRTGELRQRQGQTGVFRGVIVVIEYSESDDDFTEDEATVQGGETEESGASPGSDEEQDLAIDMIEGLWKTFGIEGARQKRGRGRSEEVFIWQWCSLLTR